MIVTLASTLYFFKRYPGNARFIHTFNKKIAWWYWTSIFSSQYDKSTDNKIKNHVEKLIEWTHPTKAKNKQWRDGHKINLKDLRHDILHMHNNADARYKGILCLPIANSKLKQDILGNEIVNFEDHHVFPKRRLIKMELGLSSEQINNIANKIVLEISSNRTIHDIFPCEYKDQKKKISVRKKNWESYIVPPEINDMKVTRNTFKSFLRKRTDLIIEEIEKVIKKP